MKSRNCITTKKSSLIINNLTSFLRQERDKLIARFQYESAIFLCEKILTISGGVNDVEDGQVLAKCFYLSKQYQRAVHFIRRNGLHQASLQCCCILANCLIKIKKYDEALACIKEHVKTKNLWTISLMVIQSQTHETLDNREDAKKILIRVLEEDFLCYEAFRKITRHHMASKAEEISLLIEQIKKYRSTPQSLINADTATVKHNPVWLCDMVAFFYYIMVKKYERPDCLHCPTNFGIFTETTDWLLEIAERHHYNFELNHALEITTSILEKDKHNFECLELHISCLLALEKSVDLFKLTQQLIDLFPEHEISWFSLGCYYHLIKKKELSRRYLQKAVTLNNICAPAWLLYGHSYSEESEHDQAMVAYFKAAHLMPGCHLPLLYIGVEYARTNNYKLGEKFILKALSIAPEDPLVLHELSVTAFHSSEMIKADRHLRNALKVMKYSEVKSDHDFILRFPVQYEPIFNNMGHIQRKIGKYNEAIHFFKRALSLWPDNASTYASIGLVYCMKDKYDKAVKYLDHAYGLNKLMKCDDLTKTLLEDALKFYSNSSIKLNLIESASWINSKPATWTDAEIESKMAYVSKLIGAENEQPSMEESAFVIVDESKNNDDNVDITMENQQSMNLTNLIDDSFNHSFRV